MDLITDILNRLERLEAANHILRCRNCGSEDSHSFHKTGYNDFDPGFLCDTCEALRLAKTGNRVN